MSQPKRRRPCPSGKDKFYSRLAAARALAAGDERLRAVRVYKCRKCACWHLTSTL